MADSIHSVRKTLRLMPCEAKALSDKAGAAGGGGGGFPPPPV